MGRPAELAMRLGWYILKNKIRRRKRFPLVTMLEPLEACNLSCEGCGRIREYEPVLDRVMSVEDCLSAVEQSGAPIVSIAGGEPTIVEHAAEDPVLIHGLTHRSPPCSAEGSAAGSIDAAPASAVWSAGSVADGGAASCGFSAISRCRSVSGTISLSTGTPREACSARM